MTKHINTKVKEAENAQKAQLALESEREHGKDYGKHVGGEQYKALEGLEESVDVDSKQGKKQELKNILDLVRNVNANIENLPVRKWNDHSKKDEGQKDESSSERKWGIPRVKNLKKADEEAETKSLPAKSDDDMKPGSRQFKLHESQIPDWAKISTVGIPLNSENKLVIASKDSSSPLFVQSKSTEANESNQNIPSIGTKENDSKMEITIDDGDKDTTEQGSPVNEDTKEKKGEDMKKSWFDEVEETKSDDEVQLVVDEEVGKEEDKEDEFNINNTTKKDDLNDSQNSEGSNKGDQSELVQKKKSFREIYYNNIEKEDIAPKKNFSLARLSLSSSYLSLKEHFGKNNEGAKAEEPSAAVANPFGNMKSILSQNEKRNLIFGGKGFLGSLNNKLPQSIYEKRDMNSQPLPNPKQPIRAGIEDNLRSVDRVIKETKDRETESTENRENIDIKPKNTGEIKAVKAPEVIPIKNIDLGLAKSNEASPKQAISVKTIPAISINPPLKKASVEDFNIKQIEAIEDFEDEKDSSIKPSLAKPSSTTSTNIISPREKSPTTNTKEVEKEKRDKSSDKNKEKQEDTFSKQKDEIEISPRGKGKSKGDDSPRKNSMIPGIKTAFLHKRDLSSVVEQPGIEEGTQGRSTLKDTAEVPKPFVIR